MQVLQPALKPVVGVAKTRREFGRAHMLWSVHHSVTSIVVTPVVRQYTPLMSLSRGSEKVFPQDESVVLVENRGAWL